MNEFIENKDEFTCANCQYQGKKFELEWKPFRSSEESWLQLAGREGYKLLCPKCQHEVDEIITKMN